MEKIDTITIQQFSVKHAKNDLGWCTGCCEKTTKDAIIIGFIQLKIVPIILQIWRSR